jgi:hypothetical protein
MKIIRITLSLFLVFCVVFTLFFFADFSGNENIKTDNEYKGILTVWNIDVFEGGKGSRTEFLKRASKSFEKKFNGLLVMVISHTEESAFEQLKIGVTPDIYSFGVGFNIENIKELNVDVDFFSGKVGDKTFCVPWCRGGYVLIENPNCKSKDNNLVISKSKYNKPLIGYVLNNFGGYNVTVKQNMDAYVAFTAGKFRYMIGTQRDVIRLETRQMNAIFTPLNNFTDLYQYLAVSSINAEKYDYAVDFIRHVISDKIQDDLYKIGMFSPYKNITTENATLDQMQNQTIKYTISPFLSAEKNKEIDTLTNGVLDGEEYTEEKIKKIALMLEKNNKI